MPLKKRKIDVQIDDDDFTIPATEHKQRKKCAKIDDGLAIKYNKLVYNFDKIFNFKHFRKYCVFFDIFSKRHLINHNYRIDMLETLNRFDFTPYAYEQCHCHRPAFTTNNTGSLICFKNFFMERRKYSNHKDDKSEYMKRLYEKHSLLYEENNFYDNRINECFLQKIRQFEELHSLLLLNKNMIKSLHKNIYQTLPNMKNCLLCKNIRLTTFNDWRIVRFSNCLNMHNLCDYVLRVVEPEEDVFLIPNYMEPTNEDTRIVVYKTTKSNIVFLHEDAFYVVNSHNLIIIFTIEMFRKVQFFCNFSFYFVRQSKIYSNNNYININNH
ncbi:hypothetical protein [Drosophila suzukii associated hytrosavirus 1]|nr:hypothetical protein [Drosophila suzukii associated hytrosavirus 1]